MSVRVGMRRGRVNSNDKGEGSHGGRGRVRTSHFILYTTTVITCDYYSKGWLGSGVR